MTKKSIDPNSMLLWYPLTKGLDIPQPRTEIVEIPFKNLCDFADGKKGVLKKYVPALGQAANKIGFPLFLRTDLSSAKHFWKDTCYVEKKEDFFQHLFRVVEFNLMADMMGLPCQAIVLRDFLELDWTFKAFMGEMPVAPEIRVFVKDGEYLCHHAYWIKDAIERGGTENLPPNWKALLKRNNTFNLTNLMRVETYAVEIAQHLKGYWSLDFAKGRDGRWYFIDAATGEASWHPADCPKNPAPKPEQPRRTKWRDMLVKKNG